MSGPIGPTTSVKPATAFAGHTRARHPAGIRSRNAHWKLDAIDAYAHARTLAWIDDSFNDACHEWAAARTRSIAPTLLVQTEPARGLTSLETRQLLAWADRNSPGRPPEIVSA